jgi:hypothetical protein
MLLRMAATRAEVVMLAVATGSVAATLHFWGRFPWPESIMAGLLAGVVVTVSFHQREVHLQTFRDIREIFSRDASLRRPQRRPDERVKVFNSS